MKVTLRYIILLLAIFIWLMGLTHAGYLEVAAWGLVPDDYRYGDLYRLSNLPQFKEIPEKCTHPVFINKQNIALYTIGDSFLEKERIDSLDFSIKKYSYVHRSDVKKIQLDSSVQNILLIECVERHVREYFVKEVDNFEVVKANEPLVNQAIVTTKSQTLLSWLQSTNDKIVKFFHFKQIDERYENLLFNSDLFLKVKEWKAVLNYHLLGKTTGNASVSVDGKHIFYNLDTDTTQINSSFSYLPDNEVDSLVKNINKSAEKYKKLGFSKVYFSIIPNKVSILEPNQGQYNHLIKRIQQHKNLHTPIIDIYSVYSSNPQNKYATSDSHWSCEGRKAWLDLVNEELRKNLMNNTK